MTIAAFRRIAPLLRMRPALFSLAAVSGLSIASSAIGLIFQILLAARFGAGAAIDSYLFAISTPIFISALGAAALSFTVVPALVLVENNPAARRSMMRATLRSAYIIAAGFMLVGLPASFLQQLVVPASVALRQMDQLKTMIFIGWTIGGVQFLSMLFVVELNAARRPIVAALIALPPNLGAILVVLLAPHSILAAPLGVLAGSIAAAILGFALTHRSFGARDPIGGDPIGAFQMRRVGWTLLAMSCFSAYAVVDAFWAPRAGEGTLASLGYAQRLVIGIGGLVLAGPSAILTPRFAVRLRDEGGLPFLRDVMRTVGVVGALALAMALVLALLADQMIQIAFARGAFEANDVLRVAHVLRFMLPGFCAMLISVVLTRAIYCLPGIERPMAMLGLTWSALYFMGCWLLLSLGGVGFGISYSLAWAIYALIATLILHRYSSRITPLRLSHE